METGIELITKERTRQIEIEGWDSEHDDKHGNEEIARAAMCYANPIPSEGFITAYWPWEREWWKPKKDTIDDRVKELTKAGALIAAEIDRLKRKQLYQTYVGKFVEFAGGKYEVVGVVDLFGCLFVEIYDEPPTKHIDRIKLSSVKLAGGVV